MKKMLVTILLLLNVICITSGCGKNEKEEADFIFGTDLCKYDMYIETGESVGINIPFAYNNSKENIKLLGVEGENIEVSDINFFDDTIEPCNDVEVDGYKLGFFGFIVDNCNSSFKVNKLHIEIAGQEKTLVFDTPLVIKVSDNSEEMFEGTTADYIGSGGKNRLIYSFIVEKNISITGYSFTGDYIIEEADITVGNKTVTQVPFEVCKDEKLSFSINTNIKNEDKYKFKGFNFVVNYITEEGEEKNFYVDVRQQAAGGAEGCKEVLKLIVK